MGSDGGTGGEEEATRTGLIRQPEQPGGVVQNDELSTFGVVLAMALCGVVFAFASLALTLPSASFGSDFLLS